MDFNYSPEDEAFRQEVREWLEANLPEGWGTPQFKMPEGVRTQWEFQKWWQRKLQEGGWAGINWPKEYGGRGATIMQQVVFGEETARVNAPMGVGGSGISLAGPTIMAHGTEEQKSHYLRRILSGEDVWCQGFSEPNAGSDLASLETKAEEDGDDFVVNGGKVWTTGAQRADWCILLVRTDPNAEKHRGISYLLMDMKTPGITVKPLVQITGNAEFNQMFLDNVRIPKKNLLGERNRGWYVSMTTLAHERSGSGNALRTMRTLQSVKRLAQETTFEGVPLSKDPNIRQKYAQAYISAQAFRYNGLRALTKQLRGEPPGPEGSIGKLFNSELNQFIGDLTCQIIGPYSQLLRDSKWAVSNGRWGLLMLGSRGGTIAAGTSEIQRNIISERVLGLPK